MEENTRRRRRVRHPTRDRSGTGDPRTGDPRAGEPGTGGPGTVPASAGTLDDAGTDGNAAERGLRSLIGGGSSQITPAAALRARDAARPGADEIARAERDLKIVRRHWTPR